MATAAALAALACTPRVPPAAPGEPIGLAIISWNMHAATGNLPRLVSDLSAGRLTAAPVAEYVLLLQEVTEEAVRGVALAPGGGRLATFFAPVRRGPIRTTGNAILSTVPISDGRAIDLPLERQPRAAALVTVHIWGERLFVVSAHLENRLGWLRGLFADRARERQAATLIGALPSNGHGIVGGDMNTMLGPSEPALDLLLARFDDTPRGVPQPTFRDRLALDHLFFDLPAGWTAARRVIPDRYGSDHHPVLGIVGLGK